MHSGNGIHLCIDAPKTERSRIGLSCRSDRDSVQGGVDINVIAFAILAKSHTDGDVRSRAMLRV